MTVLVTGANGFIGQHLRRELSARRMHFRTTVRTTGAADSDTVVVERVDGRTDWSKALAGAQSVVHLAARVHVMHERPDESLPAFREINTEGTANLAEQAASAGIRRFIYLSTIKVNGDATEGAPYRESDVPAPADAYAISKWEAEQRLHEVARRTGIELVVIRPPLVYGPGVKGNILRLLRWIQMGVPLPFANVKNHRSLVGLDNLVDFIVRCLEHPHAANETFLIADERDISTAELVCAMASGMGKKCHLFPVPQRSAQALLQIGGKARLWQRLWGDLQVDPSKARRVLNWCPPTDISTGLAEVGQWYRQQHLSAVGSNP